MMQEDVSVENKRKENSRFENLSFIIFLILVFLLPLFLLPSFSIQFGKNILLALGISVAFILWGLGKFKDGNASLPPPLLLASIIILPLAALLSSYFSGSFFLSFLGGGFEVGTGSIILLQVILLFLATQLLRSKNRFFYFYLALFGSFFLVALFQVVKLFAASRIGIPIFQDPTFNLIGKWNELALFFGLTSVLSLLTVEFFSVRRFQVIGSIILAVSLFFLVVNYIRNAWIVLGAFALLSTIFAYMSERNRSGSEAEDAVGESVQIETPIKKVPYLSLIVFVISLIFVFLGPKIGAILPAPLQISQLEVWPSWRSTISVSVSAMNAHPVFGIGPNKFINEWLLNKPSGVNETLFWNTDFNSGVGLIPTYLVTTGALGFLSWLLFLGVFILMGVRAIFRPVKDPLMRYVILSSFFGALFLWVFSFLYVPGTTLLSLAFLLSGTTIAAAMVSKIVSPNVVQYDSGPKKSFISILIIIFCLLGSGVVAALFIQRFAAAFYVTKAVAAIQIKNDTEKAKAELSKALSVFKYDEYYRAFAGINIAELNAIVNDKTSSSETLKEKFTAALQQAIGNAQSAIAANPSNYQNYITLGSIHESLLSLGFKESFAVAKEAYGKAALLNPHNPAPLLLEARLEAGNGNTKGARELIGEALKMKTNYTEAIYLLAQIEISEKNVDGAIKAIEAAASLNPNEPTVFFELGFLRYSDKNYEGARDALLRAVELDRQYSNARYFLGLSLYKLGRVSDAIQQFIEIQKFNPDNQEVKLILANLRSGLDPFYEAKPPVSETPETRKQLPIPEQ